MKIPLFAMVIVAFLAGFAAAACPDYDISGDCKIDFEDVRLFAEQWLDAGDCEGEPDCANFDHLNGINFTDFAFLANNWGEGAVPLGPTLVINEFMAANNSDSNIADEHGDYDDWVEIYNFGDTPINLAGMYLTDDLNDPTRWKIPQGYQSQTTVPADGFIRFWTDDETTEGPLHANFKLSAGGEEIGLFDTDGSTMIDGITFGEQATNISYGRYPDADDYLRYFPVPTPLADNNGTYINFIELEVSRERGFYDSAFNVLLACDTNGATIRYTLDGTEPNETTGTIYTSGTAIPITTTKCLRAIAYKAGDQPSRIAHTYIFIDDVKQQPSNPAGWPTNWGWATSSTEIGWYPTIPTRIPSDYQMDPVVVNSTLPGYSIRDALLDIPTVSITMLPEDFLTDHNDNGIYSNSPYRWERECCVEYIFPDGTPGFQYDCKIEIHGNASRYFMRMQKHSLRLTFTSLYGPPKLNFPLFPESPVDTFNQLVLKAFFTDSWGLVSWDVGRYRPNDSQYTRDVWMKNSLGDMGQPTSHGNYAHVYVDGLYFGLHNLTERFADDFLADHLGGEPEDWEINKDFGTPGTRWNAMMAINPSTQEGYENMQNYLDMENLADYMLLHFYADSEDWPHHNGNAAVNAVSGDGKFRFFVWDQEIVLDKHGLGASKIDTNSGVGTIFQKMRTSMEFRLLFADRVQKHCFNGGALSVTGSQNRYLELANMIDKAIVAESARWGDTKRYISYGTAIAQPPGPPYDVNNNLYPPATQGSGYLYFKREDSWIKERDNVINHYIPVIFTYNSTGIIGAFRSKSLFPSIDAPVFKVNGVYKFGGYVSTSDTFTITDPGSSGGTIYYTIDGNDPRVPFTGAVSSSAITYSGGFTINKSTNLKSRIYKSSTSEWSALTEAAYEVGNIRNSLRITEIMYHPMDSNNPNDPNTEYIELKNIGGSTINLNLVQFDKGLDFTFGPNTLTAGQHILVVKDQNAFEAKYGTGRYIAGEYTGSLDNGGERIRLLDAVGTTILDFEYKDGWRSIVDGDGYSLTIINPANPDVNSWSDNDSWRASAYINGSPGWDDSGIIPNPGAITINEVMAHSHAGAPDWIELYNTTASAINIGGWYLSDSDVNLFKYRFAAGKTIPAHGYIVIYEDVNFGQSAADPGRLIPFALSENGEMVCLASALDTNGVLTGYREKEDFGASETGVSFGRFYKSSTNSYNFVPESNSTQGYVNAYPKVGPVAITEIMYHPDWPANSLYENDQYEYIELRNTNTEPVVLYDYAEDEPWKLTDGIDFTFPAEPNEVIIPARDRILVVKNRAAFGWRYPSVDPNIVYGPYSGKLDNAGERVQLGKPGDEVSGIRYYIRVDRVDYSDGSHPGGEPGGVDLWPTEADGQSKSLTRKYLNLYGNDPNNWDANTPTPGS